jgi:hypothetical protein
MHLLKRIPSAPLLPTDLHLGDPPESEAISYLALRIRTRIGNPQGITPIAIKADSGQALDLTLHLHLWLFIGRGSRHPFPHPLRSARPPEERERGARCEKSTLKESLGERKKRKEMRATRCGGFKEGVRAIFPAPDIDNSFVHLGHPFILPSKDRSVAYAFIYEKFKSKLFTSVANRISHAASLTLIKSVFSSIPIYYMSNILFSKKFLAKITAIIRSLCLRAWADICIEKNIDGLGIRNLQAINQGLILSTAWRLAKEPHSHS